MLTYQFFFRPEERDGERERKSERDLLQIVIIGQGTISLSTLDYFPCTDALCTRADTVQWNIDLTHWITSGRKITKTNCASFSPAASKPNHAETANFR